MEKYNLLIKQIDTFLKDCGFILKKNYYINESDDFFRIIFFQKNKYSNSSSVTFTINVGVTSKHFLKSKGLVFGNNLMNNQWESRVSDIIGEKDFECIGIDNSTDIDIVFQKIKAVLENSVFSIINKFSESINLIDFLIADLKNHPFLSFDSVESLLILTTKYCPDKITEVVGLINSKINNSNDSDFVNNLYKELIQKQ